MPLYLFHETQEEAYVRLIEEPADLTDNALSLRDRVVQLPSAPQSAEELMRLVRSKAKNSPTVETILLKAAGVQSHAV